MRYQCGINISPTPQTLLVWFVDRFTCWTLLLQADFIVPSSREAVDCDSAWNEMLREQVPNLFLQALQSFRQLPAPGTELPMFWVNRWLQSVPLPREVRTCLMCCLQHDVLVKGLRTNCSHPASHIPCQSQCQSGFFMMCGLHTTNGSLDGTSDTLDGKQLPTIILTAC